MSDPVQNFAFFVGGIEDATIAVLNTAVGEYAGDIDLYSGELDDPKKLREALDELSPRYPLFLATYIEGLNTWETQTAPGVGSPWSVRHDCKLMVLVIDKDPRGETERRRGASAGTRGAYGMASDVLEALENRQLRYVTESDEKILLTHGVLVSTGIEHIISYEDVTAYAVTFETYFKYLTPDRREPAQEIDSIIFDFNPLNNHRDTVGAPGVNVSN